jgi:4,5-dihydroxyphthalate decarboxylase
MRRVELTIACWDYDRTRALREGTVAVEGCDVTMLSLAPEEAFFRAFRHAEFDASELSFSSYTMATSRGTCPYVAIPVFASRVFRHSGIYIRTDRGIKAPADLKGRKVGIPEYQVTAAVWIRGMLEDEYGVKPSDLDWHSGGMEESGRHEKLKVDLPRDVRMTAIAPGKTLSAMLEAGEIDAIIGPRVPSCYDRGAPHVARLFPDFRNVEKAYFKKTGIFPIMHVIGIRRRLVEAHPWLGSSLYKAFEEAKARCLPELTQMAALKITLPWIAQEAEDTRALMGDDYWPYGIEANRKTLDAFLRYHHSQGLSPWPMKLDELFLPSTMERAKV